MRVRHLMPRANRVVEDLRHCDRNEKNGIKTRNIDSF